MKEMTRVAREVAIRFRTKTAALGWMHCRKGWRTARLVSMETLHRPPQPFDRGSDEGRVRHRWWWDWRGRSNRPWRTLTAGASPFDATRQCVFLVYRVIKKYRHTETRINLSFNPVTGFPPLLQRENITTRNSCRLRYTVSYFSRYYRLLWMQGFVYIRCCLLTGRLNYE